MAHPEKPSVVDGFTAVQAVRRARERQQVPPLPSPSPPAAAEAAPPAADPAAPARFGHTSVPTRHDLTCYACGYKFTLHGRLARAFCPKCKTDLETGDLRVEGEFSGTSHTVGTIEVAAGTVCRDATLVAGTIRLHGDVRAAKLKAFCTIELHSGAQFHVAQIDAPELNVPEGAVVRIHEPLSCARLRVGGHLRGHVQSSDGIRVEASGFLEGSATAPRLEVEDGAGLRGNFRIGAEKLASTPQTDRVR